MTTEKDLIGLYEKWSGEKAAACVMLAGTGSWRKYYRITGKKKRAIGVINDDLRENHAFLTFTRHFLELKLPVPRLYATGEAGKCYLLSDLGDVTLFGRLTDLRKSPGIFPAEAVGVYKKVISWLPAFQVKGGIGLDYGACYPRASFDRQSMLWDLSYFKYYFLKLAKIPFDEQRLENDFQKLADLLSGQPGQGFLYRDFQSRNIMLVEDEPFFIDYQGGRRGAFQYDIASLLYDAKADIPEGIREVLLAFYLDELARTTPVDKAQFMDSYYGFVLIRIFQALGAYGFRGYYENKPHFLQSIPYAVENLEYLLQKGRVPSELPALTSVLEYMTGSAALRRITRPEGKLTVSLYSFSYRDRIPSDEAGNGGGFVFDCRALPNPGRLEEFQEKTGKDREVIEFLRKEPAVDEFLAAVFSLTEQSVSTYLDRGFGSLMVSFGCTGGRHRSVYCAEELARHLKEKFGVTLRIIHTELDKIKKQS
ncbi:MAG TPA: RNase adapter RapZ [Bacteroidales bacterium]|nr:RNase adapter RapZ [Bacteroidales bacterium]